MPPSLRPWTRCGYIPYRPEWCRELHRIPSVAVFITLALLIAIAVADDVTGDQITLSVLYMFPVIIGAGRSEQG